MQCKNQNIYIHIQVINPWKGWNTSNIWEHPSQIKVLFMKKLSADCRQNACYYSVQNLLSSSLLSKNIKVKINRTVILPFVSYGCETWSPIVSEEHRLRVFGNRVLRKIFGPTRDEGTGELGRQHNETIFYLYSPHIWVIKSRRMSWARHVAHGEKERCMQDLGGET